MAFHIITDDDRVIMFEPLSKRDDCVYFDGYEFLSGGELEHKRWTWDEIVGLISPQQNKKNIMTELKLMRLKEEEE